MQVAITHGTKGNPEINWFPWLKTELEALGHSVTIPQYPTPSNQNLNSWLTTFDEKFGFSNLTEKTVLVGHSIGVPFILHILSKAIVPIRACFLVSGFIHTLGIPEYDELNKSFIMGPFDWPKIRTHAREMFIYHSEDDPYVPIKCAEEIAENLGIQLTRVPQGGHLNSESGFTVFPLLLRDLKSVL